MRAFTVALSGGIGSGKSTVASYLRSCGVPVYDTDTETKAIYDKCPELVDSVCEAIGKDVKDGNGRLDRKALAAVVFSSKSMLEAVEAVVHPAVLKAFLDWKESVDFTQWTSYAGLPPFVVMESAIVLSKACFEGSYDAAVVVIAPLESRLRRAVERDNTSNAAIMERIQSQPDCSDKADSLIINDSNLATLHRRTDEAFGELHDILVNLLNLEFQK